MKTNSLVLSLTALTLNCTEAFGQTVQYAFTYFAGLPGTTTYTDTNAIGPGPFFYCVGVQE